MMSLTRCALAGGLLALVACGTKRPENAIVADFPCLEIEHYGASVVGKKVLIEEVIVRVKTDDSSCPALATIEAVLFDDADGDGRISGEEEEIFKVSRTFTEHTVSARLHPSSAVLVSGIATEALKLHITVTDQDGASFDTLHVCTE